MNRLIALCFGLAFLCSTAAPAQDKPDVDELVKQLKDKDEFVRLKAAKLLGKLGGEAKEALPALTELLKDQDLDVRAVARNAIDAIRGRTKTPVDDIVKELRGKNRLKALEQLAAMGEEAKPAATGLVEVILELPTKGREKYLETLEKIDPEASKLVGPLLMQERDPRKWADVFDTVDAAGADAKACLPILRRLYLTDITGKLTKDMYVAQRVILTMVKIDPEDKVVIQTVLGALGTTNRGPTVVRARAFDAIKELKADPRDVTKALISAMNDKVCMLVAIETLGSMGKDARDAVPILMKLKMEQSGASKDIRDAATAALQNIEK